MNHRISRRMTVVFIVLLLTSIIATSVAAMGLAQCEAQRSSRQEELRKMGFDIVDVQCASRVIAESREKSSLAVYRSVGLGLVYGGGILPTDTMMDVMMRGFLQAGEFPYTTSGPSDGTNRAVGASSVFSPSDFAAMRRIPGVRDLWLKTFDGSPTRMLLISERQRLVMSLRMSPGQLLIWNLTIERGCDFAPGDRPNDVIVGRKLADLLFPDEEPVGKQVPGTVVPMHIIGVLAFRESAAGAATGYISPYSNPNSTIFRFWSIPAGGPSSAVPVVRSG